jgi:hypothetical protein
MKFYHPMPDTFKKLMSRRVSFTIKGTNAKYEGRVCEATRYYVALNVHARADKGAMTRVTIKYTEIDPATIENLDLRLVRP